jgi:ABC-2 type transport system permease protein
MRSFWILWKREVAAYFYTPRATVLTLCFLLLTGFNFCASVHVLNHGPTDISIVEAFFNTLFFWSSFIVLVPLLTMHLFAEEYRLRTMETLVTAPISDTSVVLAKFFAALLLFILLWIPSLFYFILFWPSAHQIAAASYGTYVGAYGMLLLIGMFALSLGCLTSAVTSHQLVAGIGSCTLLLLLFFVGMISFLHRNSSPALRDLVMRFSPMGHMVTFSRGVIDSRPIVWYLSLTGFTLFLTVSLFQRCRYKTN